MKFTYISYINMMEMLIDRGYQITDYRNWKSLPNGSKCAILRHDIDYDIKKAVRLADVEADRGVKSTYFVMLTSPMYNALSKESCEMLRKIKEIGHSIGLHYDELRYPECTGNTESVIKSIINEIEILKNVLGSEIETVSMHRPSKAILEADIAVPGVINSYGHIYFNEFKYLSDSRKRWREPILDIIARGEYDKLHILTHAYWYDETECSLHDSVLKLINSANSSRYSELRDNITDIDSIISCEEVR